MIRQDKIFAAHCNIFTNEIHSEALRSLAFSLRYICLEFVITSTMEAPCRMLWQLFPLHSIKNLTFSTWKKEQSYALYCVFWTVRTELLYHRTYVKIQPPCSRRDFVPQTLLLVQHISFGLQMQIQNRFSFSFQPTLRAWYIIFLSASRKPSNIPLLWYSSLKLIWSHEVNVYSFAIIVCHAKSCKT